MSNYWNMSSHWDVYLTIKISSKLFPKKENISIAQSPLSNRASKEPKLDSNLFLPDTRSCQDTLSPRPNAYGSSSIDRGIDWCRESSDFSPIFWSTRQEIAFQPVTRRWQLGWISFGSVCEKMAVRRLRYLFAATFANCRRSFDIGKGAGNFSI